MSDYYVGEIRVMAGLVGRQPPENWLVCDGSELQISTYEALFSLLGTTFGGNGNSTFKIPDLRSRVAIGAGQGPANAGVGNPALTNRVLGQTGGEENVTLTAGTMPKHTHTLNATSANASTGTLSSTVTFAATVATNTMYLNANAPTPIVANPAPGTIGAAGANQSHANTMPSLALQYIIATNGIYPTQN